MTFKKCIVLLSLIILFSVSSVFSQVKELKKVNYYPKGKDDYYFKTAWDLDVSGDSIYAIIPEENKILRFEFKYPNINLLAEIGRPGQGPGDLSHPSRISVSKDEMVIKDELGFSFFRNTGEFISKFRAYTNKDPFLYFDEKIYWVNPNSKENHLIEVYSKKGKRIATFGSKYDQFEFSKHTSPSMKEFLLYKGLLFVYDGYLYYINSLFGDFFKFTLDGKLLEQKNIYHLFGKKGKVFKELNEKRFFSRTISKKKVSGILKKYNSPVKTIFSLGNINKGKVFFLEFFYFPKEEFRSKLKIKVLDLASLKIIKEYLIQIKSLIFPTDIIVFEKNNEEYYILSVKNFELGDLIEIYKEESK